MTAGGSERGLPTMESVQESGHSGADTHPGTADHPRTLGWVATTALAMGGSNQSLFLMTALFAGQGDIPGQGSAAVPLLILGLLLGWAAAPGWTELVLMYPKRVGGIAATCAEAFRPYNPVLANLTGVCYWWGWVPTCGLTAIFSAAAIHEWYLPGVPVPVLSCTLVLFFAAVNLCGVKWAGRLAIPIATASAALAFISALAPVVAGQVDWQQAATFHLTVPFAGWFGELTGFMAGLYLIGFAAPAFEAAACHVGETVNPNKNVPRAMLASALMASMYFIVLPVVWLGVLGPEQLGKDLMLVLGPTFAPVFGSFAKAAAIWFMMFNMFHGTLQPLAGAARTMSQLAEDGLLPRTLERRSRTDVPWVATCLTAGMAILFLLLGDPIWLVAAANFTYLIGICLPNVAVWLLRRNQPEVQRPYRAPRGMIVLGLVAAAVWTISAILGFQQFGMKTVLVGVLFAYSGSVLYAWRRFSDRRRQGLPGVANTLHIKLTGAMLLVLAFDGAGYLLAVTSLPDQSSALVSVLEDIFVAVAMLSISVGLVLPGILAHAMVQVSQAATGMAKGAMASFSNALLALGRGDLDAAQARVDLVPVTVHSGDEVGEMAKSVNTLQQEIARAATSLAQAREELRQARHDALTGLITRREFERRLDAALVQDAARSHRVHAVVPGSGLLQGRQRHLRPCGGRRAAAPDHRSAARRDSQSRQRGAPGWRRIRGAAGKLSARARRAHRAGSAANDPGVQLRVGGQGLQDRREHRPGRVSRRQCRAARADARCRRCLLRREEERPQSHPCLPAGGQRRGGAAGGAGLGGAAAPGAERRALLPVRAGDGRRFRSAQGRAPSGTAGAHDRRRPAARRSHGIHPGRRTLQPHAGRGSTGHFHGFRRVRTHHRARGAGRHAPLGDQPVGRVFERRRLPGVRSHAVRRVSASRMP